jgi:hypothetical protein
MDLMSFLGPANPKAWIVEALRAASTAMRRIARDNIFVVLVVMTFVITIV